MQQKFSTSKQLELEARAEEMRTEELSNTDFGSLKRLQSRNLHESSARFNQRQQELESKLADLINSDFSRSGGANESPSRAYKMPDNYDRVNFQIITYYIELI
jgi:hypothetical protein